MSDEERVVADRPEPDPASAVPDELVSRLQVIEEQPLEERAAAFARLHDELRAALEAGDVAGLRG